MEKSKQKLERMGELSACALSARKVGYVAPYVDVRVVEFCRPSAEIRIFSRTYVGGLPMSAKIVGPHVRKVRFRRVLRRRSVRHAPASLECTVKHVSEVACEAATSAAVRSFSYPCRWQAFRYVEVAWAAGIWLQWQCHRKAGGYRTFWLFLIVIIGSGHYTN